MKPAEQLKPGQEVLVQLERFCVDGVCVEITKQARVRNHAPGKRIYVHGHKPAIKQKRISNVL